MQNTVYAIYIQYKNVTVQLGLRQYRKSPKKKWGWIAPWALLSVILKGYDRKT